MDSEYNLFAKVEEINSHFCESHSIMNSRNHYCHEKLVDKLKIEGLTHMTTSSIGITSDGHSSVKKRFDFMASNKNLILNMPFFGERSL